MPMFVLTAVFTMAYVCGIKYYPTFSAVFQFSQAPEKFLDDGIHSSGNKEIIHTPQSFRNGTSSSEAA